MFSCCQHAFLKFYQAVVWKQLFMHLLYLLITVILSIMVFLMSRLQLIQNAAA